LSDSEASIVTEQRQTIEELETPVIQVWDGVLALPLVGSVDTRRAQLMNERLLERVVETGSEIVLVDISGVPVVDTAVSRHLLETVAAARLLGAEVIIVGLTARTAMTLVQLGESLAGVRTRTTMAKGLELALAQLGYQVTRAGGAASSEPA
jgi:rsbT co-antagonist protein RsbR